MRRTCGEQNYVRTNYREVALACGLPQNPLAPIAEDGVAQSLRSHERDLSGISRSSQHANAYERMVVSPSATEDLLKFLLGFDGLHARR